MPARLDDPASDAYLDELMSRLRAVLGHRLVGAWLANSAARGDYLPGRSDLDVAVGVADRLDERMKRRLADELRHGSVPCPAPRLELVVYRGEVLRAPGPTPDWELNLNTGPAIDDHIGLHPSAEPAHWFVLDLAMARERSVALLGPPLDELVEPIPDSTVIGALRASTAWHAAHEAEAPNRVLNACRAWFWLEKRQWASKSEAAGWAITAGGDAELIALAAAHRRGERAGALAAERVAAFSGAVARRLEAAAQAAATLERDVG